MSAGGAIVADLNELQALRPLVDGLGDAVAVAVRACAAATGDVMLAAAVAADPPAGARLEAELLEVCDGWGGLRLLGLRVAGLRVVLDVAVAAYRSADDALSGAQDWLTRHPGVVDDLIHAVTGTTGLSERQICGLLARLYPDGTPQVTLVAHGPGGPAPRSIGDVVAALGRRADVSDQWSSASDRAVGSLPAGTDDGTIDVNRLTGPQGTAWVVNLPGTSSWDLPGPPASPARQHDPADFGGDVRLLAGESTAYERGIVDAVTSLPVKPGQPILLAGHSEGGMVAIAVAGALAARGLTVTSVLAAGSPIAGMTPPAGTDVLALENSRDIVPHLDGASAPTGPQWATVTFTAGQGGIAADHSFAAYAVGAAAADRSDDPAVVRWRTRATPFLTADSSRTWVFRLQRVP